MTGQDRLFFADIGEEQTLFDLEPEAPEPTRSRQCAACGLFVEIPISLLEPGPNVCSRCRADGYEPQTLL